MERFSGNMEDSCVRRQSNGKLRRVASHTLIDNSNYRRRSEGMQCHVTFGRTPSKEASNAVIVPDPNRRKSWGMASHPQISVKTEDEWLSRTLAAMPRSPQKVTPHAGKDFMSPVKSAGMACLAAPKKDIKVTSRPTTPHSAWQARTLASLAENAPKSRSVSKETAATDSSIPLNLECLELLKLHAASNPGLGEDKHAKVKDAESNSDFSDQEEDIPQSATSSVARLSKTRRQSMRRLANFLPDPEAVLARLRGGANSEFSPTELERMKATFLRFRIPDSHDVHKDDLAPILKHLGFMHVDDAAIIKLAADISEYASMEFNDFTDFMVKYSAYERQRFQDMFEEFDDDGNSVLDMEEVLKFLGALGYTPLRSTVREAMDIVDIDKNGTLDFEEVVLLMHLYRHTEGFSRTEVEKLSQVFEEEQPAKKTIGQLVNAVPAGCLSNLLTKFFGPAYAQQSDQLSKELSERDGNEDPAKNLMALSFPETLVWARRLRDQEFDNYRAAFTKYDQDNSGTIDFGELKFLLKDFGYTLNLDAINELIGKAKNLGFWHDVGADCAMDYDAFVHFMRVLNETDGFMDSEIEEIKATFARFDEDGSEDIDVVELNDMLHYLGYSTKVDEVLCLLAKVDYNGNGSLDLREFIRFMRLHREGEIKEIKDIFEEFEDEDAGGILSQADARHALLELAAPDSAFPDQPKALVTDEMGTNDMEVPAKVSFEEFLELAGQVRLKRAQHLRKRAGFTAVEIEKFQGLFNEHDPERSGILNTEQVTRLLMTLGFRIRTVEEQQDIVKQLKDARAVTKERGITDVAEDQVDFWVLIQLLRGFYRRDDKQTLDKVTRAAEQSRFQASEVAEFQEVFLNWYERDSCRYAESTVDPDVEENPEVKAIPKNSLLRLLRSLGLKIDPDSRLKLEDKMLDYADDSDDAATGVQEQKVEFADFLRLMRWMMDTNFCRITDVVASSPKLPK